MHRLNIALVEPQIPQNTGNISRTCAVTGAALHLIKPYGFEISDKKLKRAGLDYWDKLDIYEYENLADFFSSTSGEYFYFTTKGRKVHSETVYPEDKDVYIVFGREDKGLPEKLLYDNPHSCVRIPMRNDLRSLNLSNSVAIAVYEILRQWDYPDLGREGKLTQYIWDE
ncbi:MAG: tRNA (cytidine(34)-2'-O)-methyltransferase [Ruminococcus sp.]|nr:tRNA (cytidine(34)-2'-O)-methyltransferase [Ruminococcus sp.]